MLTTEPRVEYATTGPAKSGGVKGMVSRLPGAAAIGDYMADKFNGGSSSDPTAAKRKVIFVRFERVEEGRRLLLLICHDAGFELWDLADGGGSGAPMHQLAAKRCPNVLGACLFGKWTFPAPGTQEAAAAAASPLSVTQRYSNNAVADNRFQQRSRVAVSCGDRGVDGRGFSSIVRVFSLDKHMFTDDDDDDDDDNDQRQPENNRGTTNQGASGASESSAVEPAGSTVVELCFPSRVHAVVGSPRLLVVALNSTLHGFHPVTLAEVLSVGRFPCDPRSDGACVALGSRWLAFPADRHLAALCDDKSGRKKKKKKKMQRGGEGGDSFGGRDSSGGGGVGGARHGNNSGRGSNDDGSGCGDSGGGSAGGVDMVGAAQGLVGGMFWLGKKGKKAAGDYLEHRRQQLKEQELLQDAGGNNEDGSLNNQNGSSVSGLGHSSYGGKGETALESYQALLPKLSSFAGRVAVVDVVEGKVVAVIPAHVSAPPSVASAVASSVASSVASTVASSAAALSATTSTGTNLSNNNVNNNKGNSSSDPSPAPFSDLPVDNDGNPGEAVVALAWSSSGHSLVTSPTSGQTLHVWAAVRDQRMRHPNARGGGGGPAAATSAGGGGGGRVGSLAAVSAMAAAPTGVTFVLLYKLVRGFTPARIRHLAFSPDDCWLTATSAKNGTTHVFSVHPKGGPTMDGTRHASSSSSSSSSSLASLASALHSHQPPSSSSLATSSVASKNVTKADSEHGIDDHDGTHRGGAVSASALAEKLATAAADAAAAAADGDDDGRRRSLSEGGKVTKDRLSSRGRTRSGLDDGDDDDESFALLGEEEVATASVAAAAAFAAAISPPVVSLRAAARVRSPCVAQYRQPEATTEEATHPSRLQQQQHHHQGEMMAPSFQQQPPLNSDSNNGASPPPPPPAAALSELSPLPPSSSSSSPLYSAFVHPPAVPIACAMVVAGGQRAVLVATPDGKLSRHPLLATVVTDHHHPPTTAASNGNNSGDGSSSSNSFTGGNSSRDRVVGLLSSSPVTSWVVGGGGNNNAAAANGGSSTPNSLPSSRNSSLARGTNNQSNSSPLSYSPHSLSSSPLLSSAAGVLRMGIASGLGAVVSGASGVGGGGATSSTTTRLVVEVDEAMQWDLARLCDDNEQQQGSSNHHGEGSSSLSSLRFPSFKEVSAAVAEASLHRRLLASSSSSSSRSVSLGGQQRWLGHIERRTRAPPRIPAWASPNVTFVVLKQTAGDSRQQQKETAETKNPLRIEHRLDSGTRLVVTRHPSVQVAAPPPPIASSSSSLRDHGDDAFGAHDPQGLNDGRQFSPPSGKPLESVLSQEFEEDEGELLQFSVDDDADDAA